MRNTLTYSNHLPFWTRTKEETIITKKIKETGRETGYIHGSSITVEINNKKIKLYEHLHPTELKQKIDYLKKYGFQS